MILCDEESVSVCSNFIPIDKDNHIRSGTDLVPGLAGQVHRVAHRGGGVAGVHADSKRPLWLCNIDRYINYTGWGNNLILL